METLTNKILHAGQVVFARCPGTKMEDNVGHYFRINGVTKSSKVIEMLGKGYFKIYDIDEIRPMTPEEIGPEQP
jgi:hypothetical protein